MMKPVCPSPLAPIYQSFGHKATMAARVFFQDGNVLEQKAAAQGYGCRHKILARLGATSCQSRMTNAK